MKNYWAKLRRNGSNHRDEGTERAHFPLSGRGQKRFRRSTKQQREREQLESNPKNDESAIRAVRHAWKPTRASASWNVRAEEISSATADRHDNASLCPFEKISRDFDGYRVAGHDE